jgi:hypothetical protein
MAETVQLPGPIRFPCAVWWGLVGQARVALFLAPAVSDYVTGTGITTDSGVFDMAAASEDALAGE